MKNLRRTKNITLPTELTGKYGDVDGLSLQNLFFTRYGHFPGSFLFEYEARTNGDYTFDTKKMAEYLLETVPDDEMMEFSPYFTNILGSEDNKQNLGFCIILNKSKIMARFERSVTDSYVLFENEGFDAAQKFVEDIIQFYVAPEEKHNIYWRVCSSSGGYYLDKGQIKCPKNFDVSKLYNDDFLKEDEKICKFIEEDDTSGLVILHGEKGTGKSTYIKNLVSKFPSKKFVYIPANLISLLGDPSFGSFLITLNNNIIILEDCENAIRDRKINGSASAVSLLLNMTDGILSDDLGIKFICTFNEDMKNIDPALLRKGRLISKHEFKGLSPEKASALLKERGIDAHLTKPITLAEIFHYGEEDYTNNIKPII